MKLIDTEKGLWQLELNIPKDTDRICYKYFLSNNEINPFVKSISNSNDSSIQSSQILDFSKLEPEWGKNRIIDLKHFEGNNCYVVDYWRSISNPEYLLFSKAGDTILKHEEIPHFVRNDNNVRLIKSEGNDSNVIVSNDAHSSTLNVISNVKKRKEETVFISFSIAVSRIKEGNCVGLFCNFQKSEKTSNIDESQVIILSNCNHHVWQTEIEIENSDFPIEYKYCIVDSKTKKNLFVEDVEPRTVLKPANNKYKTVIVTDEQFRFPFKPWKCAGVAIPVFSLRSKIGSGVGEFTDIKLLVDWANRVNIKIIQLLPVNDTVATHTWIDSYPYSCISVYALHPLYININRIGKLKSKITQTIIDEQGIYLNSLPKVDYEAVMRLKSRFFKEIYDEQQLSFLKEKDYQIFFEKNKEWLRPYAAFSYLRDLYSTTNFDRWGKYRDFTPDLLDELCDPLSAHFDDIAIHYFIQYHAYNQLFEAAEYAHKNGVALKGDLPIGILRNSVEAWIQPHLFNIEEQAGAPPDYFSETGQNWKFPTYKWEEMEKDNYKWWQNRLLNMSQFFDAYRIDHILGFFRIWETPANQVEGILGRFYPSLPYTVNELKSKGIEFDYERFCSPYIREHFLYEIFGNYTDEVRYTCLDEYEKGKFKLKTAFDTQKKIENIYETTPDIPQHIRLKNENIRRGLFKLVAEVIFLEAPNSKNCYVPRFCIQSSKSFQELDHFTKERLNELYEDYFYHRNEKFWSEQGLKKLPALIFATNMLVCGEDLGMVPVCVPEIMSNLGILGLEMQNMPKKYGIEFSNTTDFPYKSVATTSTHDSTPIRGWWEENPARSQHFYNTVLNRHGNSPFFCETWIVKQIIEQHLHSESMLAIFPIQDLLALSEKLRFQNAQDERVNNPGNPTHYWRYRMHINLEDLILEEEFNNELNMMILESGRGEESMNNEQ